MAIRTDLALEAQEIFVQCSEEKAEKIDGVDSNVEKIGSITKTKIRIINENGERALGKPKGTYITIEAPEIKYDTEVYEKVCMLLADEIREMAKPDKNTKTLVAGLGNRNITPDALGPEVISHLMVTNHMKEKMADFLSDDITSVSAVSPGVLGTTGIETSKIIKGIVSEIKPDLVIAVDALASRSIDRISTTVQLSDCGINPGSGVNNKREGLNEETLGVKVISIGVPTVVDAATIASDCIDMVERKTQTAKTNDELRSEMIRNTIAQNIGVLMVTPKDIDSVIDKTAKTIANGINLALHKNLTFEEIESFVG